MKKTKRKKKDKRVIFGKSGNGYLSPKISIPNKWLMEMGITEDNPHIDMQYIDGKIIIKGVYSNG